MLGNLATLATILWSISCICSLALEICCSHIDNVLVEAVSLATDSCLTFTHHYTFYFSFEELDIFILYVLLTRIVSEVVELAH